MSKRDTIWRLAAEAETKTTENLVSLVSCPTLADLFVDAPAGYPSRPAPTQPTPAPLDPAVLAHDAFARFRTAHDAFEHALENRHRILSGVSPGTYTDPAVLDARIKNGQAWCADVEGKLRALDDQVKELKVRIVNARGPQQTANLAESGRLEASYRAAEASLAAGRAKLASLLAARGEVAELDAEMATQAAVLGAAENEIRAAAGTNQGYVCGMCWQFCSLAENHAEACPARREG